MQRVKRGVEYSDWGVVLGAFLRVVPLAPFCSWHTVTLMICPHKYESQVQHSCLLQFADDTCLICSGESPNVIVETLQDDLCILSKWITESKCSLT